MVIDPLWAEERGVRIERAHIAIAPPESAEATYEHLAIHPYPVHLTQSIELKSGQTITLRSIRPEDAEMEALFVRNLSEESRYFRFMNSLDELSQDMLVRFTQIDYHNEMALIAVHQDAESEEEQIGVARFTINLDKTSCEFALVVSDTWHGKGVAYHLMSQLMQVARDRGLEEMEGQVLSNNARMLSLVSSLGFKGHPDPEDNSVRQVILTL